MVNQEKTKAMTQIAIFEAANEKNINLAGTYYQRDYISIHLILTGIAATFAYVLLVGLGIVYNLEFFMENIHRFDVLAFGRVLLIVYVGFLLVVEILAYVFYRRKYKRAKESVDTYCFLLHELERIYNQERRTNNLEDM